MKMEEFKNHSILAVFLKESIPITGTALEFPYSPVLEWLLTPHVMTTGIQKCVTISTHCIYRHSSVDGVK